MSKGNEAALREIQGRLQHGDLDGAAAGYEALVAAHPDDWTSINALGDLYIRLGDADRGVAQITRAADHFYAEGFLPKAAALYRKVLKVRPDDHALTTLVEIAMRSKLFGEARQHLVQLEQQRRGRGDAAGADDCLARIDALGEQSRWAKATAARDAHGVPAAGAGRPPDESTGGAPSAGAPVDGSSSPSPAAALDPDPAADRPDAAESGVPASLPNDVGTPAPLPSLQSLFDRLREAASEQAGDRSSARDRTKTGSDGE